MFNYGGRLLERGGSNYSVRTEAYKYRGGLYGGL